MDSEKSNNYFTELLIWIGSLDEHSKKIYLIFSDELCSGRPGDAYYAGCYEIEIFKNIRDRQIKEEDAAAEFERMHKALELNSDWQASWNMLMSGFNAGMNEIKNQLIARAII